MKFTSCGWATVITLFTVFTQGTENPRPLEISNVVTTDVLAPALVLPAKCDAGGNAYVRIYQMDERKSTVLRVSRDGKHVARFSLEPMVELTRAHDFATNGGEVYVLASQGADEAYVVRFDADGKHEDTVKLDMPLQPSQIAVFPSGDLLVAGREPASSEVGSAARTLPFLGIFTSRGQLVKRILLQNDVKPDNTKDKAIANRKYLEALVGSVVEPGDDGKLYLMRRTARGPVYAISSGGVVEKIVIPAPPQGARLSGIKVAKGRLAAQFVRTTPDDSTEVIIRIIDLQSRKNIAEYAHSNYQIGSALACYSPDSFVFLAPGEGYKLTVVTAEGK